MKISILGGGNGAFAFAFHLTQLGHEVLMYVPERFAKCLYVLRQVGFITAVPEYNGIKSDIQGQAAIARVTTCVIEALEFSRYLVLICPAFGQGSTFRLFLPHLTKDHVFISMPGNFALFDYARVIQEYYNMDMSSSNEIPFPCIFVETSTIPYACRKLSDTSVFISGVKKRVQVGVFPSQHADQIIDEIRPWFLATLVKVKNIIEAGLYNMNLVGHPPGVIFNAGWIENTHGQFRFYNDGFTPSVYNTVKAMDLERLKIGKFFGFNLDDHFTHWRKWYGGDDITDPIKFFKNAQFYEMIQAPPDLKNRYITEDFAYCLIPLIEYICKQNGIETPMSDAVITSARVMTGLPLKPARHFDDLTMRYIREN